MANVLKPATTTSTMDPGVISEFAAAEPGSAESDRLFNQLIDFGGPGETTVAAAETSQEEVYIVKQGDTLTKISQELQVPVKELAQQNAIKNIHEIMPGQEIRYSKRGPIPVETDISAPPEDEGGLSPLTSREVLPGSGEDPSDLSKFTVDTTEDGVLGPPPELAPGDETSVTKSEQEMVADFKSVPVDEVVEPQIAGGPVDVDVYEEPGDVEDLGITVQSEAAAKNISNTIYETLPEDSKPVYKDVIDEIDALGFDPQGEDYYNKIAEDINSRIEDYNINISTIASEKQKPTFEGWDKFLAVLGSALGAYGSAMTGVPNFALKVVNDAIDRDTQKFLKSQEARTKTLENQRLDLIMMRGEKLQLAQNRVTQIMQSQTFQLAKAEAKANIKATYDKLTQELVLNKENYQLVMAGMIKDFMIADATLKASVSKEERKRYVNSFSTTDADGNTVIIPGYIARDAKSAEKLTEDQELTVNALDDITKLDELYESPEKYLPAALGGKVAQEIDRITNRLELTFKKIEGMGANYSAYEQTLIRGILPTSSLIDKISKYKVKSAMLRNELIKKLKTSAKVRGQGSQTYQTISTQENIEKFKGKKISN